MLIELENVEKTYDGEGVRVRALRGVDLGIGKGEFLSIMGKSGSGKTTLISIIGGLDYATRGRIEIDGIDLGELNHNQLSAFRKEYVGFIFQQFHLVPYLTAMENVLLPLAIQDMPRGKKVKRATEVLEMVGLADKGYKLPAHLSGGEQQRVAIARALVNDPRVIIADE
ncbi:MAG: ABC transporter ATP-binding protein, partial [Candidatus Micrarchaeota archaeon]